MLERSDPEEDAERARRSDALDLEPEALEALGKKHKYENVGFMRRVLAIKGNPKLLCITAAFTVLISSSAS